MPTPEDIDLGIRIEQLENSTRDIYIVAVTEAPVPVLGKFHVFKPTELLSKAERLDRNIEITLPEPSLNVGDTRSYLSQQISEIDHVLFDALFPIGSSARTCFSDSLLFAITNNKRLRIKLSVPESLAHLPWELTRYGDYLYGVYDEFYLLLDQRTMLIRYIGNTPWRTLSPEPDLLAIPEMLIVVANPAIDSDNQPIDPKLREAINAGKEALRATLAPFVERQMLKTRWIEGGNGDTLQLISKNMDENIQILHYIGEGDYEPESESFLIAEDQNQRVRHVSAKQLTTILRQNNLRLAVFSACHLGRSGFANPFGNVAASLARMCSIPAVIAMKSLIRATTAETFSVQFYSSLLRGLTIQDAFKETCKEIYTTDLIQWATPTLILQSINGQIVDRPLVSRGKTSPLYAPHPALDAPPVPQHEETTVQMPEMVLIPAGTFTIGFTQEQATILTDRILSGSYNIIPSEVSRRNLMHALLMEPARQISLPDFHIGKYPVTNEQFAQFITSTGYRTDAERRQEDVTWQTYAARGKEHYPVVCVSWNDASEYCQWLSTEVGHAYRLPTVEEWIKAARGPNGNIYPWGNDYDAHKCNSMESMSIPGVETTEVGSFVAGKSQYDIYDLVGNVDEWTSTSEGAYKIMLGGSWQMACEIYGLSAFRRLAAPSQATNETGFRCVYA